MLPDIANTIRRSNIEVHRVEASVYDAIHPEIFGAFEQRKIVRDLTLIAAALSHRTVVRVLDIGCGTGNLTLKYLQYGYSVRAVDISPEMIKILRSKVNPALLDRVEMIVCDAEDIVANERTYGSWDVVSFSSVLHHLPNYQFVLDHALRQLRPGGILYICHEPLRNTCANGELASSALCRMLDGADNLYIYARKLFVYLKEFLHLKRPVRRIDYSWSDYHIRTGICAEEVLRDLELVGARRLLYETYRSRYSSLLGALDDHLNLSQHAQFRFIVQRVDRERRSDM